MLHTPQQVADAAPTGRHTSMFVRMLIRAAVLRRGRAASALFAMVVAAAVATAMMNLYVDVQAKLRTEFRNYGANVVVVAKEGQALPADALTKVESALGPTDTGRSLRLRRRPHQGRPVRSRGRHRFQPRPPTEPLVEGEPLAGSRQRKPAQRRRDRTSHPDIGDAKP